MPVRPCLDCHALTDMTHTRKGRCMSCLRSAEDRGYGPQWRVMSRQVITQAGQCERCGTRGDNINPLTADHVVSRTDGGSDDLSNLICLCRTCNSAKGG